VLEHFAASSPRIVYMATLGKALGGYGAFVAGSEELVEWLLQRARTYIFSTAPPATAAATAVAAIDLQERDHALVAALGARIDRYRACAATHGIPIVDSISAIPPVLAGDPGKALAWSERLLARGFLVPAIRPPTVPEGTSRLRISLSAAQSDDHIEALVAALAEAMAP
jgi:8-amino-7-oxononanoate synthase